MAIVSKNLIISNKKNEKIKDVGNIFLAINNAIMVEYKKIKGSILLVKSSVRQELGQIFVRLQNFVDYWHNHKVK